MIRNIYAGACLCLSLLWPMHQAGATSITLDTTWLDANGKLTLSTDARQTLAVTGIDMTVGGKASVLGAGVFNLPISQITADIRLLPPTLSMESAQAKGSTLNFHNSLTGFSASMADLALDFGARSVLGSLITSSGTTRTSLFSFDVTSPLSSSLKGGISVNMTLGNLQFTEQGASSLVAALGISSFLEPALLQLNFGSIDARVVPWFRASVTSVSEPRAGVLLPLGLALVAWATASARRATHMEAHG